jgi:NADPH:quinone reductase-like Zn-dependent oxidoreductase
LVDWKHVKYVGNEGSICGCDYSGTIVKLGGPLKDSSKKVGDRVAGVVHGGKFLDKVRTIPF